MPSSSNILYQPYSFKHVDQVLELLQNSFRVEEPLNVCLNLKEADSETFFRELAEKCSKEPLSFVAIDPETDKVIGCRLSSSKMRASNHYTSATPPNEREPKMLTIFYLLDVLRGDLFNDVPEANKVLKFEIVSVDKAFQRRGIAQKLIDVTIENGINLGYDHVSVTATSYKTQDLFQKMGFRTLKKIGLPDFAVNGQHPFKEINQNNLQATFMIKKIG